MKVLEFIVKSSTTIPSFNDLKRDLNHKGYLKSFDPSIGKIVLESSCASDELKDLLQKTFSDVRLMGYSGKMNYGSSAVAIIGGKGAHGIIRFLDNESTFHAEGFISGLEKGVYSISVNEYGDISNGCSSTGDILSKDNKKLGLLGKIQSNGVNDAKVDLISENLSLNDCIGRSLVIKQDLSNIACGIIGRSSGIDQNLKRVCACDGTVIWDDQKFGPYAVTPGVNDS